MRPPAFVSALFIAASVAPCAFAADAPLPALPGSSAPTESSAPAPSAEGSPAEAPLVATQLQCGLGEHAGIEAPDAETASALLCNEIARLDPPPGVRFRVTLGRLGTTIIYSVTRQDGAGAPQTVRDVRLQGIEGASVAAPRLAAAIVRLTPLEETSRVDNFVGEEPRLPSTKPGSVHFSLGLVGQLPPLDQGAGPAPGLDLHVHYEASVFEFGGGLRFGGGQIDSDSPTVGYFSAEVGGRYFVSDSDFSPYLGGGLAWEYLFLRFPNGYSGSNGGLAGYFDAGVEAFRLHHAHVADGVRFDLPFFSLGANDSCPSSDGFAGGTDLCSKYYYAPLSFEVRVTF